MLFVPAAYVQRCSIMSQLDGHENGFERLEKQNVR
jgi:hypothetical protein